MAARAASTAKPKTGGKRKFPANEVGTASRCRFFSCLASPCCTRISGSAAVCGRIAKTEFAISATWTGGKNAGVCGRAPSITRSGKVAAERRSRLLGDTALARAQPLALAGTGVARCDRAAERHSPGRGEANGLDCSTKCGGSPPPVMEATEPADEAFCAAGGGSATSSRVICAMRRQMTFAAEIGYYAEPLDYFDHGIVDMKFVGAGREQLLQRSPKRDYGLLDISETPVKCTGRSAGEISHQLFR